MTKIVNLTPHDVVVYNGDEVIARYPSAGAARVSQTDEAAGELSGVPLVRTVFGEVENLPDPQDGVMLVVSAITATAAKASGRRTDDLLLPANPVRDAQGRIIGCRAFALV